MEQKGLGQLVEISRLYGGNPGWVIAGGGNTSFKTADRLWVKASGHALGSITRSALSEHFAASLHDFGAVSRPFTPDGIVYCRSVAKNNC